LILGDLSCVKKFYLEAYRITHVLSVIAPITSGTYTSIRELKIDHKMIELYDMETESLLPNLKTSCEYIENALNTGGKVLVHCAAGVSRSASVMIAYMMWKEKSSFEIALRKVERCRGVIFPNQGFRIQLKLFELMDYSLEGDSEHHQFYRELHKDGKFDGKLLYDMYYKDILPIALNQFSFGGMGNRNHIYTGYFLEKQGNPFDDEDDNGIPPLTEEEKNSNNPFDDEDDNVIIEEKKSKNPFDDEEE